jgi:hypothetical protein
MLSLPRFPVSPEFLTIDDRSSGDARSSLGTAWRLVSDAVMGGVSQGQLTADTVQDRPCLHLTGNVSLENNGGFLQASLDLGMDALFDASRYGGVEIDVYGNGETYNVHLRTADTAIVWQSYRASFVAPPRWQTVRLPFAVFQPHRIDAPMDVRHLKRMGFVAIGRAFVADLCIGRVALYR